MKKNLIITVAYMAAILASNFIPSTGAANPLMAHVADFLHIPMYFVLTYLLIQTINAKRPGAVLIYAFGIAVAYGVFNEIVQAYIPGRYYSYADMFRNTLGAGLALFFCRIRWARRTEA